jgi:diaminopimelate decarboxylase
MSPGIDTPTAERLRSIAERHGTPAFVYFAEPMRQRAMRLSEAMRGRFAVSYAMKCNPNLGVLRSLRSAVPLLDASSAGEIARGIAAGFPAGTIAFSGPAKRHREVEYAVSIGCGRIVCESTTQIALVDDVARAQGRRQPVLLRINPARVPKRFGLQMGGRASQFGIDEENIDAAIVKSLTMQGVACEGLHVYSAGNSLDEDAIAENVELIAALFGRLIDRHRLQPRELVFGSGFGIPYFAGDSELDLERLAGRIVPAIDALLDRAGCESTRCVLEMGRWLVGPDGYLLTSVVDAKTSRGTSILVCDAGFNNHLSACGMMGTVMRRDWQFVNVSRPDGGPTEKYLLAGPLCASFDVLGTSVELPATEPGDVLAVCSSGAYGLTASPTRFISHPEPIEILVDGAGSDAEADVTESRLNAALGASSAPGVAS